MQDYESVEERSHIFVEQLVHNKRIQGALSAPEYHQDDGFEVFDRKGNMHTISHKGSASEAHRPKHINFPGGAGSGCRAD